MRIFKFGGASVKTAEAIRNVALILQKYKNEELVVILSAMGKMTNALEEVVDARFYKEELLQEKLQFFMEYHQKIVDELFPNKDEVIYKIIADCFKKIILPDSAKEEALDFLKWANLDEYTIYPDIVGMAHHIKRKIL
jgi:aspartate kinase